MVVVGGLTRLTHSGLSMVEWNITGSLPPSNDDDWQTLFYKYKSSPEFKLVNSYFTIEDFKKIFWFEYIHRFIGRILGVLFIIPFLYFLLKNKIPDGFLKKLLFLLFIGAMQGLIGWYMVKSGLIKNPNVSHYRLAFHLITAFTTFGFTLWFALDLIYPKKINENFKKLNNLLLIFFGILVLQIIYGAFVAGLKAGYVYTTYPKMGTEWLPAIILSQKPVWLNFLELHAGVQFVHRTIAILLLLLSIYIYIKSKKHNMTQKSKNWFLLLPGIVFLQVLLGIFTLIYSVPIVVAVIHQTVAFALFSLVLINLHKLQKQ